MLIATSSSHAVAAAGVALSKEDIVKKMIWWVSVRLIPLTAEEKEAECSEKESLSW